MLQTTPRSIVGFPLLPFTMMWFGILLLSTPAFHFGTGSFFRCLPPSSSNESEEKLSSLLPSKLSSSSSLPISIPQSTMTTLCNIPGLTLLTPNKTYPPSTASLSSSSLSSYSDVTALSLSLSLPALPLSPSLPWSLLSSTGFGGDELSSTTSLYYILACSKTAMVRAPEWWRLLSPWTSLGGNWNVPSKHGSRRASVCIDEHGAVMRQNNTNTPSRDARIRRW